jgi:pyruvate-formate lyase-activating enzyme
LALDLDVAKVASAIIGLRASRRHFRAFLRYGTRKKLQNLLLANLALRRREVSLATFPFILNLDPTNICNLRCPLCPTGAGEFGRPPGRMKLDGFRKVIDSTGEYLYEVNLFNFGEPLLNKDVFEMARYAHERNVSTCISTNLTTLGESSAEAMISSKLDHLVVSIDGLTPETYSKYRIGGDFHRVIDNVREVVKWKRRSRSSSPHIEWQFLVFQHNQHEAAKVAQFAKALGVDSVTIRKGAGSTDTQIGRGSGWTIEGADDKYEEKKVGGGKVCDFLWHTFTVNHDGGVSPCCLAYKREDDFANFFTEGASLEKIWNSPKFQSARSIFRERSLPSGGDLLCNTCYVAREYLQAHPRSQK